MRNFKLVFILAVLALMASISSVSAIGITDSYQRGDQLMTNRPNQGFMSSYQVSQTTIAVSSAPVKTIGGVSKWREVQMMNLSATATVYYRIDGTTQNIVGAVGIGWPIYPYQTVVEETNNAINLQVETGVSSATVKTKIRTK